MNTTERVALGMIRHCITPRLAIVTTAIACMLALGAVTAHAQSFTTWTGGGASGDWSTAGNWNGGAPTTTGTWGLTFSGSTQTSSTNTIGGTTDTITLSSLAFNNTAAMTLSAAGSRTLTLINNAAVTMNTNPPSGSTTTVSIPITLLGSSTFTINGFRSLRLDGVVSGTGSMSLASGGGILYLGNNNTFSGGFNLLGSQVDIGANWAFGNGALYLLAGTLNPRGGTKTIANSGTIAGDISLNTNNQGSQLVLNGSFDLNGGTRTLSIGLNSGGAFFGGVLSNGGITKTGSTGLLALSGANTYSGTTTIGSGTLQIGNAGATGALSTLSTITGSAGATLAFNRTNTITQGSDFNSVIGGAIGVAQVGSGTLVLNGINTFSGKTIIQSGAVSVAGINNANANGNLGTNGTIDLGGSTTTGALVYSGAGETTDRVINLAGTTGGGTLDQSGSGSLRFTANLTTTGAGPKRLTLQGSSTGAGELAGILADGVTGTTTLTSQFVTGATTITLDSVSGISVGAAVSGANIPASTTITAVDTTTRVVTLSQATTTGTTTAGTLITVAGVTNPNSLTKAGTGTWTLSNANTYSGTTSINAGTLQIGNAGTTGALNTASVITGSAGATLAFSRSNTITQGSEFNSVIGGAINVSQLGSGTLTLNGVNTYTGTTRISAGGTLVASSANALGASSAATVNNGTLNLTAAGVTYTGLSTVSGSGTINISNLGLGTASIVANGNYSGFTGAVNIGVGAASGAGKVVVEGADNAAATVNVLTNATLYVASGTTKNASLVLSGGATGESLGQLRLDGGRTWAGSITLAGDMSSASQGIVGSASGINLISGNIGESGGSRTLSKSGNGTIALSGSNSFTGGVRLIAGQLNINNANALGTGTFTISSGTIDNGSGAAITLATNNAQAWNSDFTFVGSSALNMGTGDVTLGANRVVTVTSSTLAVGGAIGGAFTLTKAGAGTLVLNGINTFSGKTIIQSGAVSVATINNANANGNLGTNGTIDLGGSTTTGALVYTGVGETTDRVINLAGTTGGGTLDQSGSGLLRITSALTTTGSGAKTLTLQGSTAGAGEVSGVIVDYTGAGGPLATALTKAGSGTWTLSGTNTYTGVTTVNAGVLAVSNLGNGGSNSGIGASSNAAGNLVLGGGSLRYTGATATTDRAFTLTAATTSTIDVATAGTTLTFTGSTASTTGALAKAGSGTLVFTGPAAYTGDTAINAGTLQLGNGGTTGALNASSAISGSTGATLAFSRSDAITQGTHFNSVIGGAINVAQIGTGTVTLSGANTYTGTTSVSSGVLVTSTSNRIADSSPILMTGGTLQFGGDDTVAAIGGTGGTIDVGISRLTSSFTTSSTFSGSLIGNRTAGAGAGFSGFSKTGSGTLTLAGNVSFAANNANYQNTLSVDGGELVLAGTTANTSMSTRIYNGSTLRFTSGSHSLGSGGLIVANGQAIVDGGQVSTNANVGFGGTGTSALTINGGTVSVTAGGIFMGNNVNAGSVATLNLNGGLLQVGQILWGGSGSGAVTFNGGTFQMQSTSVLPSGTNSVGNFLDLNVGTGGAIIDTGTFSNTIARPLVALGGTATGGLTKLGSATLTLANANTFSGGVTLSAGQLNINNANALGTGTFTISSGMIDNGSGAAITLATNNAQAWNSDFTFVGSSALNMGTGAVTLGANRVVTVTSSLLTVGGAIGGAFTFTKAGAGTLALSASNSRTQATTVNAGTISLTGLSGTGTQPSASDLANTPITINAGATLLAGGTVAGQNSHLINQDLTLNGGTLASNGTSGNSNYNFAFGGSSRIIAGGGTTSTISASIGLNGVREFQVGAGSTLTASGRIGNWESQAWGTINKTGDGTLALAANNNLYAGLLLNAGTVAVSSGGWSQNAPGYYSADFQGNATLLWAAGNTFDISASNKFRIGDGVTATLDTGANAVTLGTGIILGTNKTGALTKLGSGTLTISASNAFSGPTTISAGVLAITDKTSLQGTSGVSIAGGAGLRYTGSTDTFGKNITITAGSGTGTITNAGGGLLTLSGNLSKDNSVLRLTGGSFNVTGLITGATPGASDLIVDAATVTLSNTNTYDGPTFVYGSGTLALGIDNAIPNTSRVELGDATTRGTLATGTFSDAISQLVFSGSGGTLRLSGDKTASAQLATNGSLALGSNADLVLTSAGTSAGLYRLISATSITGSFASITGTSAAYQVVTTSTSIDYQQRAVLGAVTVTNPATAIITGGSVAFTYSVANGAFSGGASLSVTGTGLSSVAGASAGTAAGGGSTGSLAGLVFTGTGIGANQLGTFGVTAADVFGATTATGTVSVTVLDHATSSLAGTLLTGTTISLGQYNYVTNTWESGDGTGLFSIFNLASTFGASLTADLSLVGVTGTGNGFTTNLATFTDIAGGNSSQFSIFFDPSGLSSSTTKSTTFQIAMSDKTGMSGATATNTLSVTANVIIVPEPGAIALAGIGIAVAGWLACRSRK